MKSPKDTYLCQIVNLSLLNLSYYSYIEFRISLSYFDPEKRQINLLETTSMHPTELSHEISSYTNVQCSNYIYSLGKYSKSPQNFESPQ